MHKVTQPIICSFCHWSDLQHKSYPYTCLVGLAGSGVTMVLLSLFLLHLCLTDRKRIVRGEGGLLLLLFIGFSI